jgi:YegS/Rv2252/BmrU family lipid kinase
MSVTQLLYNPVAGGGRQRAVLAERVRAVFAAAGERVEPRPTEGPGHAAQITEALLAESGAEAPDVLVLGGDGTLNEAVTGALRAGVLRPGGPGPRFGILPAGTANVVARDLGLPRDAVAAAELLVRGGERPFDVGTCESSEGLRPFLLAVGIGVEAEAVAGVDPREKQLLGPAAFVLAGLRASGHRDRGLRVEATLEDGSTRRRVVPGSLTCGNSRLYGGPCRLSRRAETDDGLLELLLMESTTLPALIALGASARLGEAAAAPGVELLRITAASVDAPVPVSVHVDAEPAGFTPVRLGLLPRALRLRVPFSR